MFYVTWVIRGLRTKLVLQFFEIILKRIVLDPADSRNIFACGTFRRSAAGIRSNVPRRDCGFYGSAYKVFPNRLQFGSAIDSSLKSAPTSMSREMNGVLSFFIVIPCFLMLLGQEQGFFFQPATRHPNLWFGNGQQAPNHLNRLVSLKGKTDFATDIRSYRLTGPRVRVMGRRTRWPRPILHGTQK